MTGIIAAIVYGILTCLGGVIGYLQAGSKVSLISGLVGGILLIIGGLLWLHGSVAGAGMSLGITAALVIVFIRRWMQTRKAMPALLMIAAGSIAFVVMLGAIAT